MIHHLRPRVLAAAFFCISLTMLIGMAPARAAAQADSGNTAAQEQGGANAQGHNFESRKTANSQNLARAEQEDEEYVFKHSAAVRAVGRTFHLSPEAASSWFWGFNFLILAVFVGYFLVTGLPKAFRARRQRIEHQLIEARTATEQANERLRVVEERLGRLDAEIASIREHAERDSAGDEARIKASIEGERKKIVATAEQEISAAGAAAERKLRRFAAELAVERATARLQISEDDDRALVRAFARGLGGDGTHGGQN